MGFASLSRGVFSWAWAQGARGTKRSAHFKTKFIIKIRFDSTSKWVYNYVKTNVGIRPDFEPNLNIWCEYGDGRSKNPLKAFKIDATTTLDTRRTNQTFCFVWKQKGDKNNSDEWFYVVDGDNEPSLGSWPPPHTKVEIHSLNPRGNGWILPLLHSQRQHSDCNCSQLLRRKFH